MRYASLDYLRGLMALAILVFHYDKWLTGNWDASSMHGRLGVYAVSIFFILSGLALTLAYENRLDTSLKSWLSFFKNRIFRIFPLLWLTTLATLLIDEVPRTARVIFLNLTGLFGWVNPAEDVATGAWSIGCELVFYAGFPTLLLLAKQSSGLFLGLFAASLGLCFWCAFAWFSPQNMAQTEWWEPYVQVANQACFFGSGMAIGLFRSESARLSTLFWRILLVITLLMFAFWPIDAQAFSLIYGWNRVILSGICIVVVLAFFNSKLQWSGISHQFLVWLGAISYSLYLIHPLVFRALRSVLAKFDVALTYWPTLLLATLITLLASYVSYRYLEKPAMEWGKKRLKLG